jgi:hypothetical protein
MPDGGAHPSLNQKTYRSTYPSQNTGIETPRSANTIPARSVAVPRRTADTMPTGMPIRSDRIDQAARHGLDRLADVRVRGFVGIFAWRHAREHLRRAS